MKRYTIIVCNVREYFAFILCTYYVIYNMEDVNLGNRDAATRTSWQNILSCCGSNAFNQLSGGATVLKATSDGGSGFMELYYPSLAPFQLVVKDTVIPVTVGKPGNDSKLIKNKASSSSSINSNNVNINSNSNGTSAAVNQYIKHVCCGSNATCVVVDAENWDSNKLYVWGSGRI